MRAAQKSSRAMRGPRAPGGGAGLGATTLAAKAFGFGAVTGSPPTALGFRRPRSCLSHRRMVSRPISIPNKRRPPTSDSADSPARLKRSSSSRCGSSWAVAWLRGCRAWATAWASVVGRTGGNGWSMVSGWAVDGAQYAWRLGGARGAPRAHSKRKRLDVGVLPYCFLLSLLGEAVSIFGSFIGWLMELVDCLILVRWVLTGLVSLCRWFSGLLGRYLGRSFFAPVLVFGGGGC